MSGSRRRHREPRSIARALALALILTGPLLSCSGPERPLIKEVESGVMCPCPDNCGKVLINCICGYSPEYRAEIQKQIDAGMGKEEIIAAWVEKYGRIGLSAPTDEGFDLLAWTMPFVALLGAVPLVMVLIRRLGRDDAATPAVAPAVAASSASDPEGDAEFGAQLDRELDELDR